MTKPTDQPVVAERRAGDRLKQSRYVDTIITKPTQPVVLVDREEAAKVADRDAKEWKAVSTNYLASDPMKTKAVARACMAEEIAIAIRHLPPYTTAPQFVEFHACDYDYSDDGKCIICGLPDNAPTTEARERAQAIVREHLRHSVITRADELVDTIAAALQPSTPSKKEVN